MKDLHEISHREMSRAILRTVVAVVYVVTYQISSYKNPDDLLKESLDQCLELLLGELAFTIPVVEAAIKASVLEYQQKHSNNQWDKWCELNSSSGSPKAAASKDVSQRHQVGRSGFDYL